MNIILGAIKDGKIVYSSEVEFDKDIFDTLYYNIIAEIEESIKFKADGFKEEKEFNMMITAETLASFRTEIIVLINEILNAGIPFEERIQ